MAFIGRAAECDFALPTLTSMVALVRPEVVEAVIDCYWQRNGQTPNAYRSTSPGRHWRSPENLVRHPIRVGNLASIRIGQNLMRPAGPCAPYWLVFAEYDVKNRQALGYELHPATTAMIDRYLGEFRPLALDRRPQLAAALGAARQAKCPVLVAKLDRLSRDVAFISGLMATRSLHRGGTRGGCRSLHAAPLRGTRREGAQAHRRADPCCALGSQSPGCATRQSIYAHQAAALGRAAQISEADRFAASVLPIVRAIQDSGVTSLAAVAYALNTRSIRSARGGQWHVSSVRNLLDRAERP